MRMSPSGVFMVMSIAKDGLSWYVPVALMDWPCMEPSIVTLALLPLAWSTWLARSETFAMIDRLLSPVPPPLPCPWPVAPSLLLQATKDSASAVPTAANANLRMRVVPLTSDVLARDVRALRQLRRADPAPRCENSPIGCVRILVT